MNHLPGLYESSRRMFGRSSCDRGCVGVPQGINISFHLYQFYLLIYFLLPRAPGPGGPHHFGCDSGEPKRHLPSATGSASHAPAAGQVSLAMSSAEVRRLQLPQRWEEARSPCPDSGCS